MKGVTDLENPDTASQYYKQKDYEDCKKVDQRVHGCWVQGYQQEVEVWIGLWTYESRTIISTNTLERLCHQEFEERVEKSSKVVWNFLWPWLLKRIVYTNNRVNN